MTQRATGFGVLAFGGLGMAALLGNGLKSIITSTLFISEGAFASFLTISVERTNFIVELIVGSMVIALALAPLLITQRRAPYLAALASILAAAAFAGLGLLFNAQPSLPVRELGVALSFVAGGLSLGLLAPLAQFHISSLDDDKAQGMLTTLWSFATPFAFLVTPQLVNYTAHDIGIGNFFLIFAALPLVYLAVALPSLRGIARQDSSAREGQRALDRHSILLFVGSVLAFQIATALGTLVGWGSVATLVALAVFGGALVVTATHMHRVKPLTGIPNTPLLLLLGLFLLQIPTTGFFDTVYLVRHLCSASLIADRASIGALGQAVAVLLAGALVARNAALAVPLIAASLPLVFLGIAGYAFYPTVPEDWLFIGARLATSIGMGLVTATVVVTATRQADRYALLALLPAGAIMIGTEAGLELLEIAFAVAKVLGASTFGAYRVVFLLQIAAVAVAALPLLVGLRRLAAGFSTQGEAT